MSGSCAERESVSASRSTVCTWATECSSVSEATRLARRFCWSSSLRTWARRVGATRSPSRMPNKAISSARSRSSFAAETAWASCSARSVSFSAALNAEEMERTFRMREVVISRRAMACSSVARRYPSSASPMARRAARRASGSATPRERRYSCTCSSEGTGNCTGRQRERIVTSTSVGEGAVNSQMVCGGGSSMALSSTFEVRSGMRSVSSSRITRQRPTVGRSWAFMTSSRASSMLMFVASVLKCVKSACEPFITVTQPLHSPHPRFCG